MDRSLPPTVAHGLDRFDEVHAVALVDVYKHAEGVPDTQWIADAGDRGWCAVTQNKFIFKSPTEVGAIIGHDTKVFSLARADWPSLTQGLVIGRNFLRILNRTRQSGGCFWRISERDPLRDLP